MAIEQMPSFDGVPIAFEVVGTGPDVILLHGFASDHRGNWVQPGIRDAIVACGRRVIAYDARGHGDRLVAPGSGGTARAIAGSRWHRRTTAERSAGRSSGPAGRRTPGADRGAASPGRRAAGRAGLPAVCGTLGQRSACARGGATGHIVGEPGQPRRDCGADLGCHRRRRPARGPARRAGRSHSRCDRPGGTGKPPVGRRRSRATRRDYVVPSNSLTSFAGATQRYASARISRISVQSGFTSSRTPIHPR